MTVPNNKRFKSRALRVLFHILPSRTKRVLFISSLSGKVTGQRELDRNVRLRLLGAFSLCNDPDAIALPVAYNEKIWANRPIDSLVEKVLSSEELDVVELTRIARQIVAMMPCWLVYGQTMHIVQEVRELLSQRNELFTVS